MSLTTGRWANVTTNITPAGVRPHLPPNNQTFRINYQSNVHVIVTIDLNSWSNYFNGEVPPSWISDFRLYYNGSLLYVFGDLKGVVWNSTTSHPFNDPNNLYSSPGVAFWTTDGNVIANYFNLMSIGSLSLNNIEVISVAYDAPCFKEGSKILTEDGYKPVEQLRKGDKIMTYFHGLKAIDMIGKREIYHPAKMDERSKEQLYKCSPSAYPELTEDLVITGAHSILVTEFKDEEEKQRSIKVNGDLYVTDGKGRLPACADERATVYETAGTYMIYHFALEHDDYYMNYGVYANGLLVETCSKRYMKELSNMELLE
jgi:hypothetical protein